MAKQKNIPTGKLSRLGKLTGLTASVGLSSLGSKIARAFVDDAAAKAQLHLERIEQARKVVQVLSQMKGAAMKFGQMLSLHGEYLLPKEVAEVLSGLQQNAIFMDESVIDKVLRKELGTDYRSKLLDFTKEPIAAASIGQVHRACLEDGTQVAVKVQYPGVAESIESDVDTVATLIKVAVSLPSAESFNDVIAEVKDLLRQETDYRVELANLDFFREYFRCEPSVMVPESVAEFSTGHVLTTHLIKGQTVQEFAASDASEELRAHIGLTALRVLYHELFRLGKVQTDPNFGNYKILPQERKLVLFDFGAVRTYEGQWHKTYLKMIRGAFMKERKVVLDTAYELGFLKPGDSTILEDLHCELCEMFLEPYRVQGPYDFRNSDLPIRLKAMIPKILKEFQIRQPPKQVIFLNRKMVGVYLFLSAIGAKFDLKPLRDEFVLNNIDF